MRIFTEIVGLSLLRQWNQHSHYYVYGLLRRIITEIVGAFVHRDVFVTFTLVMLNIVCNKLLPNLILFTCSMTSCKHVCSIRVENNVDPDQLASGLDLQCFQKRIRGQVLSPRMSPHKVVLLIVF